MILEIIKKLLSLVMPVVNNMIRYAKITLVKNGKTQTLQVATVGGEVLDNVKFIESYGMAVFPLNNSEAIIVNIQGDQNNRAAITVGCRALRPQDLNPGEVSLYDNSGNRVNLRNGGVIEIISQNKLKIKTQTAEVEASSVIVKTGSIELGAGGQPVARLGDTVEVDPITHKGTITAGSGTVRAA